MPPDITFTFARRNRGGQAHIRADAPLQIAVLGNACGRTRRSSPPADGQARCRRVDIDTIEDVIAEWTPEPHLVLDERSGLDVNLRIRSLDDFHPDALYQSLPVFSALRDLAAKLNNPATFAEAAAQLAAGGGPSAEKRAPQPAESSIDEESVGAQSLDDLLARPAHSTLRSAGPVATGGLTDKLIRAAVDPHVVPRPDPRLEECLAQVRTMTSQLMRMILHHQTFQDLEAFWRGLDLLVRQFPPEDVHIHLIDVTRDELGAALGAVGTESGWLGQCIRDVDHRVPGDPEWTVITSAFSFGPRPADLALLEALAHFAESCAAPVIAEAHPEWVGARNADDLTAPENWRELPGKSVERWTTLRHSGPAERLALAMPRFLGRLPYGRHSDPISAFEFEEIVEPDEHNRYLWTNPAFLGTIVCVQNAQAERGEAVASNGLVEDIPFFTYDADGRTETLPPAEVWMPDRIAENLLRQGISPVQSIRGRNAVRIYLRAVNA